MRADAQLILGLSVAYAVIAFGLLSPDAIYSGDMGLKYVQAKSLAAHGFTELTLVYPGALLDSLSEFFPFQPPFTFTTPRGVEAIYPPLPAILYAPFAQVAGLVGMTLVSLVSVALVLWQTTRLGGAPGDGLIPLVLGFGTPLWFYAIVPWEHAPALAFDTAAFVLVVRGHTLRASLAAGLCLGTGVALRGESLLLIPALFTASWLRFRSMRPLMVTAGALFSTVVLAALMETGLYQRPLASHLRVAVPLVRSVLPAGATAEVSGLPPLSWSERYDIVVHGWIVGSNNDWWIMLSVAAIVAAAVLMRLTGSAAGVLMVAGLVFVGAFTELVRSLPEPRWISGLFRLAPFLIFSVLPAAASGVEQKRLRITALVAGGGFVILAIVGAETSGGKSLGPRLLLPVLPLVSLVSWQSIVSYLKASHGHRVRWLTGVVGVGLVIVSIALQVLCMLPPFVRRNYEDRLALEHLKRSTERVVVADDQFTAQLLAPLYFRKILMVATDAGRAKKLAKLLAEARLSEAVVVSRSSPPTISLDPYRLASSEEVGRLTIQRWRR